ncbi:MAG: hypothetical protein Q7S27_01055 [Nanoarchaeota archaeon]|nr:hypothetical protein [Nanoarchaeota archaeon]
MRKLAYRLSLITSLAGIGTGGIIQHDLIQKTNEYQTSNVARYKVVKEELDELTLRLESPTKLRESIQLNQDNTFYNSLVNKEESLKKELLDLEPSYMEYKGNLEKLNSDYSLASVILFSSAVLGTVSAALLATYKSEKITRKNKLELI